jgi:hypothetical protein
MSIKDEYTVRGIPKEQTHEWLLKKHYAHRIPSISYAFGLYDQQNIMQGVCTYGSPCKLMNDGYCIFGDGKLVVDTFELNRLVVSEPHDRNIVSYFVGKTIKLMPKYCCLVSYSDIGESHSGYIYQATNWVYTGITEQTGGYTYWIDNDWQHPRTTVSLFGTREHEQILKLYPNVEYRKVSRKHRYMRFNGNIFQKKEMLQKLKYPILPYPKGDNQRYDASYEPTRQGCLL